MCLRKVIQKKFPGAQLIYGCYRSLRCHHQVVTLHSVMTETMRLVGCEYIIRKLAL